MTLTKPIKRDIVVLGHTIKHKTACGNLYLTINYDDDDNLIECFIRPSKTGGCWANLEGLGRMISLALRYKIPKEEILKQLHGIRCPACTTIRMREQEEAKLKNRGELPQNFATTVHFSCPDSVSKAIGKVDKTLKRKRGKNE